MYWELGKRISESQIKGTHGKSVVEKMASDLRKEFPGMIGFSSRNMWYMKNFYKLYKDDRKLQPMVAEISWTKHIILMERSKDLLKREFYIRMTKKYGWTKNVLMHQIDNKTYEKTVTGHTNFSSTLPENISDQAKLAVNEDLSGIKSRHDQEFLYGEDKEQD
jgi:predicted nuclease of restriction endonuclease-like (RecB) superfamily